MMTTRRMSTCKEQAARNDFGHAITRVGYLAMGGPPGASVLAGLGSMSR